MICLHSSSEELRIRTPEMRRRKRWRLQGRSRKPADGFKPAVKLDEDGETSTIEEWCNRKHIGL